MFRFDIVFFNYNHLYCFVNNFKKILNFDSTKDRVICVTASSSRREQLEFERFCKESKIENFRYLPRKNLGLAEMGRLDYFSGKVGGRNFDSLYVFQMQEHYLDLEDSCSRWKNKFDNRIKGDVSPDIKYDLNEIESLFDKYSLTTMYSDRGLPYLYSIGKRRFIAPDGGNFIIRTNILLKLKKKLLRLRTTCDNSYNWALFMEYYWGELFFEEGNNTYDYQNKILYKSYIGKDANFKLGSEDYYVLRNKYLSAYFYPEYQTYPKINLIIGYLIPRAYRKNVIYLLKNLKSKIKRNEK